VSIWGGWGGTRGSVRGEEFGKEKTHMGLSQNNCKPMLAAAEEAEQLKRYQAGDRIIGMKGGRAETTTLGTRRGAEGTVN